jgi:small conductance mechanosensitive channel
MLRYRLVPVLSLSLGVALASGLARAESGSSESSPPVAGTQPRVPTSAEVRKSQAERVLRLEQSIEQNEKELAELRQKLDDPQSEYAQAKAEFTRLDKRLKEREKELTTRPAATGEPDPLAGLRKARELAKERFNLAIKENEVVSQQIATLEKRLRQDRDAVTRARSGGAVTSAPAPGPGPAQAQPGPAAPPARESAAESAPPAPGGPVAPQATVKVPTPGAVIRDAVTQAENRPEAGPAGPAAPAPKEVVEAQQQAKAKRVEVEKAAEALQSLEQRVATLREDLQSEHQLLEMARGKARNAQSKYDSLREYIQKLISTGAEAAKVNEAWTRLGEAEKQAAQAEAEVNKHVTRLDELQSDLADLQAEHIGALKEFEQKQGEARRIEERVQSLQNPFSLFNILQWLLNHGPRVVGIALGMLGFLWVTRAAESRIIKFIARGDSQGTQRERESRARTLASVFRNVASTAVICGGILMILTEFGINIVPLLGGAAVVGLAVAFGAQSLIKDYFYGFMILLENQYAINDVVRIGDAAGMVERITLRMTVLRDTDGAAHFIPHGEIQKVTNMTHGWSRAVFDIGVGYGENVDEVMAVLTDLGRQLRREPKYSRVILEDPEMLGVDQFGDSAVIIRFLIKTRPLQQWTVKREMLRRIKNKFDELKIEIPFPHRVVLQRSPSGIDRLVASPDGDDDGIRS